jgi:hypothetical protein
MSKKVVDSNNDGWTPHVPNDDAPSDADKKSGKRKLRPFTIKSPNEFLDANFDHLNSLLGNGIIRLGMLVSMIGPPGVGKTRSVLWMCLCMITGRKFCGLDTTNKPPKILFLSSENGELRWQTDLRKYRASFSDSDWKMINEKLRIFALTPEEDSNMMLSEGDAVFRLDMTLDAEKPDFIVFDPFANMVAGDENKNADVTQTLNILRKLVQKNCPLAAVMIIHHSRTGAANVAQAGDNFNAGNVARGGKALYGSVRAEVILMPGDREDETKLVLFCGKANDARKFKDRGVKFDPETFIYEEDPDFDVEAWRKDVNGKCGNASTLSIKDVVEAVQELCPAPGDTVKMAKIKAKLDEVDEVHRSTIQKRITEAIKLGYLISKQRGVYRLGSKPLPK